MRRTVPSLCDRMLDLLMGLPSFARADHSHRYAGTFDLVVNPFTPQPNGD